MYKSYYGKRHWTLHVIPLFSVSAETLNEKTQVIVLWFAWLLWQKRIEFSYAFI